MHEREGFRQIVFKMAEAAQPEKKRWLKIRETVDTMILGTLSTSIGVVILIVGLMGTLGYRGGESHDLLSGTSMPGFQFGVASIIGEGLGLAGLALGSIRRGTISPLSAIGTVVCLVQMYLFFGQFILMQVF